MTYCLTPENAYFTTSVNNHYCTVYIYIWIFERHLPVSMSLYRVLHIFWPKSVSNEELYKGTNTIPLSKVTSKRKWQWMGYTQPPSKGSNEVDTNWKERKTKRPGGDQQRKKRRTTGCGDRSRNGHKTDQYWSLAIAWSANQHEKN